MPDIDFPDCPDIPARLDRRRPKEIKNSGEADDHPVPDDMPSEEADNSETQGPQPEGIVQTDLKPHPFADMFPRMQDGEFADLVTSIKADGLEEPIVKYDGKILDGRNRYAACIEAEVEPLFTEYEGDDPLGFVLRKNLHRRHLQVSQRAMIAAKMANLPQGGDRKSEDFKASNDDLKIKDAARILSVSPKTLERAKSVLVCGDEDLIANVESGEVSVSAAAKKLANHTARVETHSESERESQRLRKLWDKTGVDGRELFLEGIGVTT